MTCVLITGSRAPVALDLARALRTAGYEVHVADVRKSRMLAGFPHHRYAAPVQAPEVFAEDILRLNSRLVPDLIIPMCEEVFHLARVTADHPLPLYAPPFDQLMRLHSKLAFNAWVRELGLDAPVTERVDGYVDAEVAAHSVFKPEFSRFGISCYIKPYGEKIDLICKNMNESWLRQDYIAGDDLCFYALASDGRLTAFAAYRSDWRTDGGASYHFQPLDGDLAHRLRTMAARLAAADRLTGQIACDLRHAPDDRLWLIECNPRATSGLHLLTHDPAALGRALLAPDASCLEAGTQSACVGPAMMVYGAPQAMRTGRVGQWRRDLGARDVVAGARLAALADSLGYGVTGLIKGQSLAAILTRDIECNGWPV